MKDKDTEIDGLLMAADGLVQELRSTVDEASRRLRAVRAEGQHGSG